jgi:hypothetical protein
VGSGFPIDPQYFRLDDSGVLRGSVPGGIETLAEVFVFFAHLDWKAEVSLVAR